MDNVKTGAFIKALRTQKGMTQKQLADVLHLTDRAVSKWERGRAAPDLATIEPLAAALGCTATELIAGKKMPIHFDAAGREQAVRQTLQYSQTVWGQMLRGLVGRAAVTAAALLLGGMVVLLTVVQLKGDGFAWSCIPAWWQVRGATRAVAEGDAQAMTHTIQNGAEVARALATLEQQGITVTGWRAPLFLAAAGHTGAWLDNAFVHIETELYVQADGAEYRVIAHGTCQNGKAAFLYLRCGMLLPEQQAGWLTRLSSALCTYDPG